jgi:chromosome segregation ATPase
MRRNAALMICLFGAGLMLTGCINIKADASRLGGRQEVREIPPPNPDADPRRIAGLPRENIQLRQNLAQLEHNYRAWQAAIDRQKDEKKALENQRDDLEKQRDRAKKALKGDD